jgi:hypothetical protein
MCKRTQSFTKGDQTCALAEDPNNNYGWWTMKLDKAYVVNKYSFSSWNSVNLLRNWTLLGSNNGTTYTQIDSNTNANGYYDRSDCTFTKEFTNTTAYQYYQIRCSLSTHASQPPYKGSIYNLLFYA